MIQKTKAIFTLTSPLHTGAEQSRVRPEHLPQGAESNYTPHRRLPVVLQYEGHQDIVKLPAVSGNTIRHVLRESLVDPTLTFLGLQRRDLPKNILEMLVSGGGMDTSDVKKDEKEKEAATKIAGEHDGNMPILVRDRETLRSVFPILSLFGASYGNRMLPGLLRIGWAIPALRETAHITGHHSDVSYSADIFSYQLGTRHDPVSDAPNQSESRQSIYYFEVVSPGIPFSHEITLDLMTDVERGALQLALDRFQMEGKIGGKTGTGLGFFTMTEKYEQVGNPSVYMDWLKENKAVIIDYLDIWNSPQKVVKKDQTIAFPDGISKELDRLVEERQAKLSEAYQQFYATIGGSVE